MVEASKDSTPHRSSSKTLKTISSENSRMSSTPSTLTSWADLSLLKRKRRWSENSRWKFNSSQVSNPIFSSSKTWSCTSSRSSSSASSASTGATASQRGQESCSKKVEIQLQWTALTLLARDIWYVLEWFLRRGLLKFQILSKKSTKKKNSLI